ncbi:hypothetical protein BGX29_006014 [Mortierella sp. GBA35]|nr:hypothetical protein BGX29_006014 [Mortierella sp. GBA35]
MPDLSRHLIRGGSRPVYLPRMDSWPQQILESGFSIRNDDSLPSDSFVHPLQLHRRRLTPNETEYLLRQYRVNEKPNTKDRLIFAAHLDLHPRTIQVWFQNRRAKLRRENSQARRLLEEYNQMRAHDDESYGSNTEDGLDENNRAFDNLCDLDSGSSSGDSSTHETDFGQSGQAQQYQWKTRESDDKAMPEAAAGLYNHQEAQTSLLDPQFRQSRDITNAFLGPFYSDLAWAWQVGDGSYAGGVSSNQARPDAAPPVHVPKRSTVDAKILSNSRQRRSQLRHKIKINDRGSSRSVSQDKGIATTRRARSQFLFEPQQKGRIPNHQRALTLVSSTSESHPSI